jgi:hypothetical protein
MRFEICSHPAGTVRDAPVSAATPHASSEATILAAGDRGVRGIVVRLSPSVHGAGDHGFVPMLIGLASINFSLPRSPGARIMSLASRSAGPVDWCG